MEIPINPMWKELIPADKIEAVQRALNTAFPTSKIAPPTRLAGGGSNAHVFRFEVDAKSYLLRIDTDRDALRDPARQYACFAIAAKAGVAPQLHYANAEDGVAISAFISTDAGPTGAERIAAIAAAIKTLHATPLFPPLVDFWDAIGMILGNMAQTNVWQRHCKC